MSLNIDRARDTIAKLLNLAKNDAATEGEVNNAIRFARKLMLEHNLSEKDIVEENAATIEEQIARAEVVEHTAWGVAEGKKAGWEGQLAVWVTKFVPGVHVHYGSKQIKRVNGIAVMKDGRPVEANPLVFYGLHDDVLFAKQTFEEMAVVIASMARLKFGGVFRGPGKDYCVGFVRGLYEQIRQADREQLASDSTALAVRRDALVKVKEDKCLAHRQAKLGRKVRSFGYVTQRSGVRDDGAYSEGRADGSKASVAGRQQRLGGSQRLLG